jgi:hypothetical protein
MFCGQFAGDELRAVSGVVIHDDDFKVHAVL